MRTTAAGLNLRGDRRIGARVSGRPPRPKRYREPMTASSPDDQERTGPTGRFADDLIGLDPQDPEVRAFAEHLDRMEKPPQNLTVEGYLDGVTRFADSANRTGGLRRQFTVLVVLLLLLSVGIVVWNAVAFIVGG